MKNNMLIAINETGHGSDQVLLTWDDICNPNKTISHYTLVDSIMTHFDKEVANFNEESGSLYQRYVIEDRPEEYNHTYNEEGDIPLNNIQTLIIVHYMDNNSLYLGIETSKDGSWNNLKEKSSVSLLHVKKEDLHNLLETLLQSTNFKGVEKNI